MPLLKKHEWRYFQSTGKLVYTGLAENEQPYFIHLDPVHYDGEAYIEREMFKGDLLEDDTAPSYVVVDPKLLKNTVTLQDGEEVDVGYILKWEA